MFFENCPNCFCSINPGGICMHCGYDCNKAKHYEGVIPEFNILNARYLVGRVLGRGGFGVTYLSKDMATGKIVAVKECFPEGYSYRVNELMIMPKPDEEYAFSQCKKNFREETRALVELKNNPFVSHVSDYFSENNTEYFVMEYIDGVSVKFLTNTQGGRLSFENAVLVLLIIGSALMEIHRVGIIHRDISPENIMIDKQGNIKLIDFGASKNYLHAYSSDNESIFLKPGFAPPEQYNSDGAQGPWTDVYALAATFYTIVSGQPLIDSNCRLEADNMKTLIELGCDVPVFLSDAIHKALEPDYKKRYQSVSVLLDAVSSVSSSVAQIDDGTLTIVSRQKEAEKREGARESLRGKIKFPYVEIVGGRSAGRRICIPDYGFISIGRNGGECDITLYDYEEISRLHCLVGYDRSKNRFIVVDRSSNGTYYSNSQRMLYNADSFLAPEEEFFIYSNELRIKVRLI